MQPHKTVSLHAVFCGCFVLLLTSCNSKKDISSCNEVPVHVRSIILKPTDVIATTVMHNLPVDSNKDETTNEVPLSPIKQAMAERARKLQHELLNQYQP